jgi:SulP family sulfate permease
LANAAYFISDPILVGFKTGAALYIASTQLPKLFGIEGITGNFFERVGHVLVSLPETNMATLLFGLAAIAAFVAFDRFFPGRPTTLIVVVAAIAVMSALGTGAGGIKIVGDLPTGLPPVGLPRVELSAIADLVPVAFACFMLAYGEAISIARAFAQKHGYEIDPEQELTALGAANLATGMAHGFPVAGGMSQSAVNDMGGASSPVALLVTSGAIALTLLFFAWFFHNLPEPVLGAIVLMAASHLVRLKDLQQLRFASRTEFRISLLAFAGVLFFGLLDGLLLAAVGSLVMLIAQASRPAVVALGYEPATSRFISRARYPGVAAIPGALVLRCAGAWLYFNAEHIRSLVVDMVAQAPGEIRTVVLDFSIVPSVDITAGGILRALARSLKARGVAIGLAELHDDVLDNLKAVDAEQDLGPLAAHRSIQDCLAGRGHALSGP